jgi:hypothetical protein
MLFLLGGLTAATQRCYAQAVPDSSLNNIIDDTLHKRKPAAIDTGMVDPRKSTADKTPLIEKKATPFQPNPKKSGLYSALLPGLGQLYNRQYWKLPLVYAGVGAVAYYYVKNYNDYQSYRKAYLGRINNPNPTDKYVGLYGRDELQQRQDDSKKYLDLTVLLGAVGYTLQVLDAVTAAHLKNFDVSRDISMRIVPVATPMGGVGLGLAVNF